MQNGSTPGGCLEFLTAEQIAARLGVTKKWVQRYTREGVIPAISIGRKSFYEPGAVDEAIRSMAA